MTLATTGQRLQVVMAPDPKPFASTLRGWTLPLVLVAAFLISSLTVSWVYDLAVSAATRSNDVMQVQISSDRTASYGTDGAAAVRLAPLTQRAASDAAGEQ